MTCIEPLTVYGDLVAGDGPAGTVVSVTDAGVLPPPGDYVGEVQLASTTRVVAVRVSIPPRDDGREVGLERRLVTDLDPSAMREQRSVAIRLTGWVGR